MLNLETHTHKKDHALQNGQKRKAWKKKQSKGLYKEISKETSQGIRLREAGKSLKYSEKQKLNNIIEVEVRTMIRQGAASWCVG